MEKMEKTNREKFLDLAELVSDTDASSRVEKFIAIRDRLEDLKDYKPTFREKVEYRFREILSALRSLKQGLINLWKWRKVIFKDRYFDHYYLYEILEFKLTQMADNFEKNHILENSPKVVAKMREIATWISLVKTEFGDVEYEDLSNYLTAGEFNKWVEDNSMVGFNIKLKTGYIRTAATEKYKKLIFKELEENINTFWD
jgi:hypothetical protein